MSRAARIVAAVLLALFGLVVTPPTLASAIADEPVVLTLYYGRGCPHCAAEKDFLENELAVAYPTLVIEQYEVWYDEANLERLVQDAQRYGFEPSGVPVTIVDGRVFIGFGASTALEIEAAVSGAVGGTTTEAVDGAPPGTAVDVPVVGPVDLADQSLLVSTLVIGFVDGINPCSLWVLSVLLAIVLHSRSRGRVVLVGTTFLAVTAGMYALYIVGLYAALDVIGGMAWIRLAVAAVALTFGVLQIKDAFTPGHGPSLSIPTGRRPGLYARMRSVGAADRGVAATVAGTVVLAVGVSLLETPCTAGLPLLWTTLLTEQAVSTGTAAGLFAVYMAVFLLDEVIVFTVAVVTLRATKISQRHGRALKLVAGSLLVTLAGAVALAPQALTSLLGTLAVFGAAALLALVLWQFVPRDSEVRRPTDGPTRRPASAR